ncbi:MAG: hypothetical protein ACI8VC_000219 [Candidatus Endobugula sp.]|jgi:hypothetical protein
MYEAAFNFFLAVGIRDKDVATLILSRENKKNVFSGQGNLVFTLPVLHQWLMAYSDRVSSSYVDFRKILYASELNAQLAKQGYYIALYQSSPTNHVDSNCYFFSRLPD